MSILLTGASGFIGKAMLSHPMRTSIQRAVYRAESRETLECKQQKKSNSLCSNPFFVETINKDTCWTGAFDSIETIVHLAGIAHTTTVSQQDFDAVNTEGTIRLATEAARGGVKRVVYMSSALVSSMEEHVNRLGYEVAAKMFSPQVISKFNAEQGLKQISSDSGIELVILRPALVYGFNPPGNMRLLYKLVEKIPALPFKLIDNQRDFVAVENLVDLIYTCASHESAPGNTFMVSDTRPVSIREFTETFSKSQGYASVQLPIPGSVLHLAGKLLGKSATIEQLIGDFVVDTTALKQILNWTPPYTMEEAMNIHLESKYDSCN